MDWNKIGVICAMDEERDEVMRHLENVRPVLQKAGLSIVEGNFGKISVYLVTAGIGKVNSAMCTQVMIDSLDPDILLNIGVAGALAPDLEQGDIIISEAAQEHDLDCSDLGDPKGVIPRMDTSIFPADQTLARDALKACEQLGCHGRLGKVVSGDQFIANAEKKNMLVREFQGDCAEMEGAAMAHVCYLNQKPWLIIRSISDKADGEAELSYPEFKFLAARRAGELFACIMKNI